MTGGAAEAADGTGGVGVVAVSHSADIAAGLEEMVAEMVRDRAVFRAVGGAADGRLGTDPEGVRAAVTHVLGECGDAVLLADIGSAVMAVETVRDLLGDDVGRRLHFADAPLVEGTVAAAVEASVGSGWEAVVARAEEVREVSKSG